MRAIVWEVSERQVPECPEVWLSAERVQQKIRKYYQYLDIPVSLHASDLGDLAMRLASVRRHPLDRSGQIINTECRTGLRF